MTASTITIQKDIKLKFICLNFHLKKKQFIGFFHTGAYQESLSGFGGIQHCLIPYPKHVILKKAKSGMIIDELFSDEQNEKDTLKLLGY